MIRPSYLKKGDNVIILAPAGKIDLSIVESAKNHLENWDLNVELSENINKPHFQFSAKDDERLKDLQQALNNENIKAIFCARGGYGSIKIAEKLNFDKFKKFPKWIIGYSDITILHSLINSQIGVETIHGIMPINFPQDLQETESTQNLKNTLFEEKIEYKIKSNSNNISGNASAELVGGNLSILYSLRGTDYDIDTNNKILFIEEIGEYLYHIDRIMHNLKIGGKLENLKGLIVGGFTDIKDNENPFGQSIEEIILDAVKEYNFPVLFDFPAGHMSPNMSLFFGRNVEIDVTDKFSSLKFNN